MENVPPPLPSGKNPLAGWSLGLGLAGILTCLGFILGIPGAICGHMAYSRSARRLNNAGRGLAIGGLIASYIAIAMLPIHAAFLFPVLAKANQARQRAIEAVCKANLYQLADAKARYATKHKDENPSDVETLLRDGELQAVPRCPKKGGYRVGSKDEEPSCSVHGDLLKKPAGGARIEVEKP